MQEKDIKNIEAGIDLMVGDMIEEKSEDCLFYLRCTGDGDDREVVGMCYGHGDEVGRLIVNMSYVGKEAGVKLFMKDVKEGVLSQHDFLDSIVTSFENYKKENKWKKLWNRIRRR